MASILILLIVAGCAAFQFLKGSITRGVATIIIALVSSFLAFGYYELLAGFLSGYVASVGPWAQLICYLFLFVIGFALMQTGIIVILHDPIDLGDLAEKIGRPICGVILGLIISGVVVTAVSLAPIPAKYPYARFDTRNPDVEKPKKILLNADGLVTGLFSTVSKGSFKAISKPRSFATLHASFLDQLFLNRHGIAAGVSSQAKSGAVVFEMPRKAAAWAAPDNLENLAGEALPGKAGHQAMIIRFGLKRKALNSNAATFTLSQVRAICKPRDQVADSLSGSGTPIYPVGYMYNATQVDIKRLGDKIQVKGDDFDGQPIRWIDFLFQVPGTQVPVLAQFKLTNADSIPKPVSGDDIPTIEGFGPGPKQDDEADAEPPAAGNNEAYPANNAPGADRERSGLSDFSQGIVGPQDDN
jgi:hypothetical protein